LRGHEAGYKWMNTGFAIDLRFKQVLM